MLIFWGQCGRGFGTDIGYVNIVGLGKGRGWGQTLGILILGRLGGLWMFIL